VYVHNIKKRLGPGCKADAHARGQDLTETVEAHYTADLARLRFEREVGWDARLVSEVEVVVRVVCHARRWTGKYEREESHTFENDEVVLARKLEHFEAPVEGGGHARRIAAVLQLVSAPRPFVGSGLVWPGSRARCKES
jgi:hypothetical protein